MSAIVFDISSIYLFLNMYILREKLLVKLGSLFKKFGDMLIDPLYDKGCP